jgi:hypothetical protein
MTTFHGALTVLRCTRMRALMNWILLRHPAVADTILNLASTRARERRLQSHFQNLYGGSPPDAAAARNVYCQLHAPDNRIVLLTGDVDERLASTAFSVAVDLTRENHVVRVLAGVDQAAFLSDLDTVAIELGVSRCASINDRDFMTEYRACAACCPQSVVSGDDCAHSTCAHAGECARVGFATGMSSCNLP